MQFRNNKIHRKQQNKNSRLGVFKAPAHTQQASKLCFQIAKILEKKKRLATSETI